MHPLNNTMCYPQILKAYTIEKQLHSNVVELPLRTFDFIICL